MRSPLTRLRIRPGEVSAGAVRRVAEMRSRTRLLYALGVVGIGVLVFFALNAAYGFLGSGAAANTGAQRTATVARGTVQSSVSASGNVGVARTASANFATSGTVTAVHVSVGDHVKAGQALAQIDSRSARNALQTAEANLAQAKSTLASAQSGLTAAQRAADQVSIQQAQQTLLTDEQQLTSDKTTLASAREQLARDARLGFPAASSTSSNSSATGTSSAGLSSTGTSSTGSSSTGTPSTGSSSTGSSSTGSSSTGSSSTGSSSTGSSTSGSSSTTPTAGSSSAGGSSSQGTSSTGGSSSSGTQPSGSSATTGAPATTTTATTASDTTAGARNGLGVLDRESIAAVAPTVTTGTASAVSSSGATLGGSVDPAGLDTTYHFEYGTSPTSLTLSTVSSDAGAGSGSVPVNAPVTGLLPSQNYWFRLVATNSSGTTDGSLALFTTSPAAPVTSTTPTATTGQASAVGATTATLSGSVTTAGLDTTYYFAYGTSPTSLGSNTSTVDAGSGSGVVPVSATLSGLSANQTYYFELIATNSAGTTDGTPQLFKTTTLAFATTGQASAVAATTATLAGSVGPAGLDTTYHFQYGTSATNLDSATATHDAGSGTGSVPVSASLTGLRPEQDYYFELVATNSSGTATGAPALFRTGSLTLATTGQASSITASAATLGGTVNPGGLATTYYFAYGTSATSFNLHTAKANAGSATGAVPVSASVSGLKADQNYYFELIATNSSGTTTGAPTLFTTGALTLATTGQATSITSSAATLGGTVSPGGLATTYSFAYGTSATNLSLHTGKVKAGSGTDSVPATVTVKGLKPDQIYYFSLVATNTSGTSDGAVASFTTGSAALSATTGQASAVGSTTATLSGSVNPGSLNTTSQFQFGTSSARLGSATANFDVGSGSGSVSVTSTVKGLKPDTTYHFRLVARNASGSSDGVEETFTTSSAAVPAVVTNSASAAITTSVTLSGSVNPNGSDTTYWFEYGKTSAYGSKTAVTDGGSGTSPSQVTATLTGLKPDTAYVFRLVAKNAFGTRMGVSQVATTAATSRPADEQAVTAAEQAVQRQEATVAIAKESLVEAEANAASDSPSAETIAQDAATVSQDETTVAADRQALAETTLRAPIGGVVTAVNGSVGGSVTGSGSTVSTGASTASSSSSSSASVSGATGSSSSSSSLITIDSLGQLEIVAGFAEADATKIAVGEPATITFPALTNTEVAGRVVAVASTSQVVSNVVTYNETILLVNPPAEVKDGMTAEVSVVDESRTGTLELPSAAITTTGTVSTVQLLRNGQTTVTPVTIGLVGNSSTQILSGLKAGDVVVEPTVAVSAASSASTGAGGLGGGGFAGGGGFPGGAFPGG